MNTTDKLTVDYRDYDKPKQLPQGRLIEANEIQMHIVGESGKIIIVPRAFHAYSGDPFEQLRDRVLTEVLDAQIVGIDIPGVGLNQSSKGSPWQRKEALRGSLASRSEAMIKALATGLELSENTELHFIGYSLGAWATAAILQSPTFRDYKLRVGTVSMVEPVNDQDWQIATIHRALLGEFGHEGRYKDETASHFPHIPASTQPENHLPMKPKPTLPSRESLLLGKGLGTGFAPALARAVLEDGHDKATGLSEAPFTLYRANGSFAARQAALEQTRDILQHSGQKATRLIEFSPHKDSEPHRHLFWHSMGAAAVLASSMRQLTC